MKGRLGTVLVWVVLCWLPMLLGPAAAAAESGGLGEQVASLAAEYRAQMAIVPLEAALGAVLGQAGETWRLAALHVARNFKAEKARVFLEEVRTDYNRQTAGSPDQMTVQMAGLNLMFQGVDALALVLATHHQDQEAIELIKETERKIVAVYARPEGLGPALAAVSGGVMTLLGIAAGQVDGEKMMADTLAQEFERRRAVDGNISNLKDIEPGRRILLLANNHLQGALSMIQIIGLVNQPALKPGLARIEQELIKSREASLEEQVLAGAKAVTESGFLVAPTFQDFGPEKE
ncbi:MAG: hypothetical protein AB1896_07965 [Thermodesulfobacteriota bacterium]